MNEEAIFHQALAICLPKERAAYLEKACAGDPALRESIEALLIANEGASGFLRGPAPALRAHDDQAVREGPGTVIGPYKLLELIGEGGMGVVYMAEQTQPMRRKIALKIIKPGMDTRHVIARFEAERQALAMMEHPNIARVLDAGSTESGRPYFVMELVRGIPITDYCDQERLTIDDRLDLFVLVCQAVQHAHQRGIIHRDIKPSNVLITLHDGVPVPKVIDFGIAKATGQQSLTDKTLFTGFAQLMGTPLYMSPEQAALSGIDVDTRSDIYSLGVLLYELLTGTTPFDKDALRTAGLDEVWRIIREDDPPTPSTRLRKDEGRRTSERMKDEGGRMKDELKAPRRSPRQRFWPLSSFILHPSPLRDLSFQELDWIVMKSLEKDRRRRYETASAFAADVARYQSDQPVEAGPPSAWYRGRKFARRHRLGLAMSAVAGMSIAVVSGMWIGSRARLDRASRAIGAARTELDRRALEARRHRYVIDIQQAYELWQAVQVPRVLELLEKWRPAPGEPDARNFAWYYLLRLCHDEQRTLRGHDGAVYHAEFSPDGRTLVSCGQDGTVRFWEVATGRWLRTIVAHGAEVNDAAFAPDGRTLATVSDDGTIKIWSLKAGSSEPKATIAAHKGDAIAVRFTSDGRRLVTAGRDDCLIKIWDMTTRTELASTRAHDGKIESLVLAPNGETLATAGGDGYARLWDVADLARRGSLLVQPRGPVYGLAFSADCTLVATGDAFGRLKLWNASTGKVQQEIPPPLNNESIHAVCLSSGDRTIVSGGDTGNLKCWNVGTGQLGWLLGHTQKVWGISTSPDGLTFATASSDGTVKLWDSQKLSAGLSIPVANNGGSIAFTPDGQTLIETDLVEGKWFQPRDAAPGYLIDANLEVNGFDTKTGARQFHRVLDRGQTCYPNAGLSSDAAIVFFLRPESTAMACEAWEVTTGRRLAAAVSIVTVSRSRFLAIHHPGEPIELLDALSGQKHVLAGTEGFGFVEADREGRLVAVRTRNELAIWDLAGNQVRSTRRAIQPEGIVAAFSPDATILAIGANNRRGAIQLWDVNSLDLLDSLPGHSAGVNELDFSPDGKVLASAGADGVVKLWDVAARMELLTVRRGFHVVSAVRFAPDGWQLAFRAGGDGGAQVCLLPTALPEDLASEEGP